MSRSALLSALVLVLVVAGCKGRKDEVRVFAAASLSAALAELEDRFEASHPDVDVDVRVHAAGSQLLATQLLEGAPAELFLSADVTQMTRVAEQGLVAPPVEIAKSRLVLVVARGAEAKVRGLSDLSKEDVRLVLAGEAVPAGAYARTLLSSRGLLEGALLRTVSFEDNVTGVLTKVALGEADAGLVYETDARAAGDKVVRVPLDGEGQPDVAYVGALTRAGVGNESARTFFALLRSSEGQSTLTRHGFTTSPRVVSTPPVSTPAPEGAPAP